MDALLHALQSAVGRKDTDNKVGREALAGPRQGQYRSLPRRVGERSRSPGLSRRHRGWVCGAGQQVCPEALDQVPRVVGAPPSFLSPSLGFARVGP